MKEYYILLTVRFVAAVALAVILEVEALWLLTTFRRSGSGMTESFLKT